MLDALQTHVYDTAWRTDGVRFGMLVENDKDIDTL